MQNATPAKFAEASAGIAPQNIISANAAAKPAARVSLWWRMKIAKVA
jgi:hypothetical protein